MQIRIGQQPPRIRQAESDELVSEKPPEELGLMESLGLVVFDLAMIRSAGYWEAGLCRVALLYPVIYL